MVSFFFVCDCKLKRNLRCIYCVLSPLSGLTVNAEGLLVTVETSQTGILTIVTMNPTTGNVQSRVKVDLGLNGHAKMESKPRFIAWQGERRLLVVDLGEYLRD